MVSPDERQVIRMRKKVALAEFWVIANKKGEIFRIHPNFEHPGGFQPIITATAPTPISYATGIMIGDRIVIDHAIYQVAALSEDRPKHRVLTLDCLYKDPEQKTSLSTHIWGAHTLLSKLNDTLEHHIKMHGARAQNKVMMELKKDLIFPITSSEPSDPLGTLKKCITSLWPFKS